MGNDYDALAELDKLNESNSQAKPKVKKDYSRAVEKGPISPTVRTHKEVVEIRRNVNMGRPPELRPAKYKFESRVRDESLSLDFEKAMIRTKASKSEDPLMMKSTKGDFVEFALRFAMQFGLFDSELLTFPNGKKRLDIKKEDVIEHFKKLK